MIAPFDWDGAALKATCAEWIIDLTAELTLPQLKGCLHGRERHWQNYRHDECPGELKTVSSRIQDLVLCRTGVALLRCGLSCAPDEARLLQLILGCEFGENVTETLEGYGRPLFSVHVTGDPSVSGRYSGNGLRANRIGFHTDGSGSTDREVKILSMLCIRPSRFGGQSRVANAQRAYRALPSDIQAFLEQDFPRENPYAPELPAHALKRCPIFRKINDNKINDRYFSYHPDFIRNGIGIADRELGEGVIECFKSLDNALERFSCDINLMTNEILFVNNRLIAHDRGEFFDDPNATRLLERFWAGTYQRHNQPIGAPGK